MDYELKLKNPHFQGRINPSLELAVAIRATDTLAMGLLEFLLD